MSYFNGDDYKGFGIVLMIIFGIFIYGLSKFSIWIAMPTEFVVTKDMILTKRIVTDGIKVDTVLVYKFSK